MSNRTYTASDESWDLIFNRLDEDIEDKCDDLEVRQELSKACEDVREVNLGDDKMKKWLKRVINTYQHDALEHFNNCDFDEDNDEQYDHVYVAIENLKAYL